MDITMDEARDRAQVLEHHIENTAYTKYPGNYHGISDEWDLAEFKRKFKVQIVEYVNGRDLEIDLIGIAPAVANALRRIMIAEVPTIAFEHVFIYNNTSVIQDEMLSHRIGMIPLRVDPTLFLWKKRETGAVNVQADTDLVFELKAKCEKIDEADPDRSGRRQDLYHNYRVYSGQMVWMPMRGHDEKFVEQIPRPVHKKILVAKLSNNQEIDLKLHANKGIGRDHAKFSPVATASYRLKPDIKLLSKIEGEAAERLRDSFSEGVIKLSSRGIAKVQNSRIDSGSRNVFRHPDLKDKVKYELIKDHYIFKVESTGCIPAMDILLQSCHILEQKCNFFLSALKSFRSGIDGTTPMVEDV